MADITIREAQDTIDRWIKDIGVRYFSELTNLAQLVEEVGELSRIMSRTYGDQSFKGLEKDQTLSDELADVLFVLICIGNETKIVIETTQNLNQQKTGAFDQNECDHHEASKILRWSSAGRSRGEMRLPSRTQLFSPTLCDRWRI